MVNLNEPPLDKGILVKKSDKSFNLNFAVIDQLIIPATVCACLKLLDTVVNELTLLIAV